jgi:hypothetical protein
MSALYNFPREEFLPLLENAIHFLTNYLCRPQWTIENFVFESGGSMSAQDVVAKLDCTVDYAYFRTLIQKILKRRETREISTEEFRTMLIRIDDQIVKQHNARELALLAKPIFDFLLLRDTPPDVSIPLKPILVFFEDKKMTILRDYIESICLIRRRTEITLDELTTLVEDLYIGQGDTPAPIPRAGEQEEPKTAETETGGTEGEEEPPESETPSPADVLQRYEPTIELQAPSIFGFVTEEPDGRDDRPLQEEPRLPESYERLFAGSEPRAGLIDLRVIIHGHDRSRFVKRLFDRNEDRYEDVISSLNNCETWRDASFHLNTLYTTNGLDPFDPDVVEFTDAIHRRYLNAEKDGL